MKLYPIRRVKFYELDLSMTCASNFLFGFDFPMYLTELCSIKNISAMYTSKTLKNIKKYSSEVCCKTSLSHVIYQFL